MLAAQGRWRVDGVFQAGSAASSHYRMKALTHLGSCCPLESATDMTFLFPNSVLLRGSFCVSCLVCVDYIKCKHPVVTFYISSRAPFSGCCGKLLFAASRSLMLLQVVNPVLLLHYLTEQGDSSSCPSHLQGRPRPAGTRPLGHPAFPVLIC